MLIIAHNDIFDPTTFWLLARQAIFSLPPSLKIHGLYPSSDQRKCTSIWEAESVHQVQEFMDRKTAGYSVNHYYEISVELSVGLLPKMAMTQPV
jgi:hypothetical protein